VKKGARLAPAEFHALAEAELAAIPKPLRELLVNVSIETKDGPGIEAQDLDEPDELLGLYAGATRAEMLSNDGHGSLPAKVYLYQRNLEDISKNAAELRRELRLTLRHELAHHFGFDDEDLERVWPEGA
jgi:predicted Zn-dependent protease with MMP-like domain